MQKKTKLEEIDNMPDGVKKTSGRHHNAEGAPLGDRDVQYLTLKGDGGGGYISERWLWAIPFDYHGEAGLKCGMWNRAGGINHRCLLSRMDPNGVEKRGIAESQTSRTY